MNHRSPVQPLKTFLTFHPMLPGMFFLVPAARASLLTQISPGGNPLVGCTEFAAVNRGGLLTMQSNAKQETVQGGPAELGQ